MCNQYVTGFTRYEVGMYLEVGNLVEMARIVPEGDPHGID